jgi:hypothetical protein
MESILQKDEEDGDKVGLYFLTETKNIEDAKFLFKIYGFDNVSVVDSSMNFYKTHNLNPILRKDVVFLLDSTNIILTIGNPIENLKIDSLFNSVIFDHLSKKGHSVNL